MRPRRSHGSTGASALTSIRSSIRRARSTRSADTCSSGLSTASHQATASTSSRNGSDMPRIDTPRLALIPATPQTLRAELEGRAAFSRVLGIDVSPEWPPELYDDDATRWVLRTLEENSSSMDWAMYYLARARDDGTREVIGTGGFKGPPDDAGV